MAGKYIQNAGMGPSSNREIWIMAANQKPHVPTVEHRHSPLRRQLNEAALGPDGVFSEAKVMAIFGQFVCLYLLLFYTEEVLKVEYTLLTLLSFVIIPDSVKKIITMRYGGNGAAKPAAH